MREVLDYVRPLKCGRERIKEFPLSLRLLAGVRGEHMMGSPVLGPSASPHPVHLLTSSRFASPREP